MASETDRARSYLHRVLADGARPFRYRGRVRALLGLPDDERRRDELCHSRCRLAASRICARRFTGEFDVGDEMPGGQPASPRRLRGSARADRG